MNLLSNLPCRIYIYICSIVLNQKIQEIHVHCVSYMAEYMYMGLVNKEFTSSSIHYEQYVDT